MRGHGLGLGGRAGFVQSLRDDRKDAIAAHREGEPVALAHLAERPHHRPLAGIARGWACAPMAS